MKLFVAISMPVIFSAFICDSTHIISFAGSSGNPEYSSVPDAGPQGPELAEAPQQQVVAQLQPWRGG